MQEYRARKRQRLQKKLADQLRTSLQQSQSAAAGLGVGADLQSVLDSFAGELINSRSLLVILFIVETFFCARMYIHICSLHDMTSMLYYITLNVDKGFTYHGTGSRFQHAEKLQFATVCHANCI